jgi:hypothetical protein
MPFHCFGYRPSSGTLWHTLLESQAPQTDLREELKEMLRDKRRKNPGTKSLFLGSVGWLILVGIILIPKSALQGPAQPFSTVKMQLKGA